MRSIRTPLQFSLVSWLDWELKILFGEICNPKYIKGYHFQWCRSHLIVKYCRKYLTHSPISFNKPSKSVFNKPCVPSVIHSELYTVIHYKLPRYKSSVWFSICCRENATQNVDKTYASKHHSQSQGISSDAVGYIRLAYQCLKTFSRDTCPE